MEQELLRAQQKSVQVPYCGRCTQGAITCMMRRNLARAARVCWARMRDLENSLQPAPRTPFSQGDWLADPEHQREAEAMQGCSLPQRCKCAP